MTTQTSEHINKPSQEFGVEQYFTIQQAAIALGVHPWALRRAVKSGAIPAYQPFNRRKLVRMSEVVAAINASRVGGENV